MVYILIIFSFTMLLSHAIFLTRGLYFKNRSFTPKNIDRMSKNLSLILTIPTMTLASIRFQSPIWSTIIWLPIVLIILSNFIRSIIIKHPYILPCINLIIYILIFILSLRGVISL